MKPRIALFGLPPASKAKLNISVYANPVGNAFGDLIFDASNDDSGKLIDYVRSDIEIDNEITIVIMSSGICYYSHKQTFNGSDISHVPNFSKETNTDDKHVSSDWDIDFWRLWREKEQHEIGVREEKRCLMSRHISVAPIWESYYADSNIDYFEKFQKLWIGLNSYASHSSPVGGDKKKILSLVETDLREAFNEKLSSLSNQRSAEKWTELQKATGLNMTSNIVRDEIAMSCHILDFFEQAKIAVRTLPDISKLLDGMVFLDSESGKDIFQHVFTSYHQYSDSEEARVKPFNLAYAFQPQLSPDSVKRIGRLVFHDPVAGDLEPGSLFSIEDFFGSNYAADPYLVETDQQLKRWETIDPLFFRYLLVLYKFRCAYFHGELTPNNLNNELARMAYQSLYELFPAIL